MAISIGNSPVQRFVKNGVDGCKAYLGRQHDPVWLEPNITHATITNFGARIGSNPLQSRLTINRDTDLPETVVIRADISSSTGWTLYRIYQEGSQSAIASGFANTNLSQNEWIESDFYPPASGWIYTLVANAENSCGNAHASIVVRSIAKPTLTAFSNERLIASTGETQFAFLNWNATIGDPAATWAITQSGSTPVADLPSSRLLVPANGRLTGTQRIRVTVPGRTGGTTTLTLTGTNEAGSVSRSTTISWAGGS